MRVVIHGIRNCGTMKKAFDWLDAAGVAYGFHDYKVAGLDRATLAGWVARVGWEALLNRSGMTFRKLDEARMARSLASTSSMLRACASLRSPSKTTKSPLRLVRGLYFAIT